MTGASFTPTSPPLRKHDYAAIAAFVLIVIGFSAVTLIRSAYLDRPMTDAQVYFRAGWAIWAGISPYEITDDNGWGYFYPPFFAILMAPFANAPSGEAGAWFALPYPAAILMLFYMNFAALLAAVWIGAGAIDRNILYSVHGTRHIEPGFWQPWWHLRLGSTFAFLFVIGEGIGRGQVTPFVFLLTTIFVVLMAANRSFWAGAALSVAAAIKVYPAFALILAILRRDWMALAGFLAGSVLLFGLLPYFVLGVDLFQTVNEQFLARIAGIALGEFKAEGIDDTTADSIGFGPVVLKHAAMLLGGKGIALDGMLKIVHYAVLFAILAVFAVLSHGKVWSLTGPQPNDHGAILLGGAIVTALTAMAATAAQIHYITTALLLYMLFVAWSWRRDGSAHVHKAALALAVSYWLFPVVNGWPELGAVAWIGVSVYPLLTSVAIGLWLMHRWPAALTARGG